MFDVQGAHACSQSTSCTAQSCRQYIHICCIYFSLPVACIYIRKWLAKVKETINLLQNSIQLRNTTSLRSPWLEFTVRYCQLLCLNCTTVHLVLYPLIVLKSNGRKNTSEPNWQRDPTSSIIFNLVDFFLRKTYTVHCTRPWEASCRGA